MAHQSATKCTASLCRAFQGVGGGDMNPVKESEITMASVEKFSAGAVRNQLRHNRREIEHSGNPDIDPSRQGQDYVLSPDRGMTEYDYFLQRKSELYCYNRDDIKVMAGWVVTAPQDLDPHLNPNYNFENFIKGNSNEFSRTVGETVAKNPAKTFNPLFLYGPSGVGKTHLTNAIGTRIKELYPEKRVLYVSAHLFQVQYTDSVRTNHFNDFISFYQTIDVLIIDDIQEFAGVTKTQNTFFHIFNHLHQNGKQLILTSDRAPVMLQGMEERLLTRFKWGLVAELEKPDVELRKNILRNKIRRDGLNIPETVINYIAENVNESVRELEGIINSLLAQSIIFKRDVDLDLAERIVRKAVRCCESKPVTVEDIIQKVCSHYEIEESAIHTKTRKREVVQVRQVAMYLAKKHTDSSSSKIGKLIGNKDHATVLHACKIVKDQVEVDKAFKADIEEIEASLKRK